MSGEQSYQYFPAIRCWVKHLLEANFNAENKSVSTKFGEIKRVRLSGTILDKNEFISKNSSNEEKINLRFNLDDGTGLINAIKWDANPDRYKSINKGDLVNLVGRISKWNEDFQVTLGIIKKIEDPNLILLHDSEILTKISKGNLFDIPEKEDNSSQDEDIISEEEILYESKKTEISFENKPPDVTQERIFSLIEEKSQTGKGISLEDLNSTLKIPKNKLITYLITLERASRIYQSEENVYQSF